MIYENRSRLKSLAVPYSAVMERQWIADRLIVLGKTQADMARAMGLPTSRIAEILGGKRRLQVTEIGALAAFLGIPVAEVLALASGKSIEGHPSVEQYQFTSTVLPASIAKVPVMGEIQAGTWREAVEWEREDWVDVEDVAVDPEYPDVRRFALRIVGQSVNKKAPDGSIAICVKFIDIGREPRHGEFVVVYRKRRSGLTEVTIKQYIIPADGGPAELWPCSDHPRWQEKLKLDPGADGDEEITVHALVRRAVIDF